MRPHTKPTPKQIVQMDKELKRLLNTVGADWIQALLGVQDSTIRGWVFRGRISAKAANELCKCENVQGLGFTRESLRPDVEYWYV